jgi:hypothetical protein
MFAALQDRDHVERVLPLVEEALGSIQVRSDLLGMPAREYEKLEPGIGRRKILNVDLARVGRTDEYVWEQALADDKIRRHTLICRLGFRGRCVVNSHAR